jgi:serine/threonine protein kinase
VRKRLAVLVKTSPARVRLFYPDPFSYTREIARGTLLHQLWKVRKAPIGFTYERYDFFDDPLRFRIDFSHFRSSECLGSGYYGEVCKVTDPSTGEVIALKTQKRSQCPSDVGAVLKSDEFREVVMLIAFAHPCILAIRGWNIDTHGHLQIGTELMPNGSLHDICSGKTPRPDNTTLTIIIVGIVLGMKYIHSRGAVHRDLKPANVFLDEHMHAQIADLGLCRPWDPTMPFEGATAAYSAPEVIFGLVASWAADVFSFGVILYELIVGRHPFSEDYSGTYMVQSAIVRRCYPPIPSTVKRFVRDLIEESWAHSPSDRPPFAEILDLLKENNYEILDGVDSTKVTAFVITVEMVEKECLTTPVSQSDTPQFRTDFTRFTERVGIARGKFTQTFSATDPETHQVITLKLIPAHPFGRKTESRAFFREIEVLVAVTHPCVLSIVGWDLGASEHGRLPNGPTNRCC